MINVTLVASTPQEAYTLTRERYGDEFTLISAKQIRQPGEENICCEITISVTKERFLQISDIVEEDNQDELMDELFLLRDQIAQMKTELQESEESRMVATQRPKNSEHDSITQSVIERVKALFFKKGIAMEWLEPALSPLVGSTVAEDEKLLVAYLLEEIDETIQIKEESIEGQKVMMFVGSTGVGKTTTIAKLAARYAYLQDKQYRVALINLDSFKVGAFEQLAQYAEIMKLEYLTASSVKEFKEVFNQLSEYDVILIDTAGMSPYDTEKLIRVVEYLSMDTTQSIEVNLMIPATVKYEDIEDIYSTFSFLNLDSVILSKFDETKHLGTILSYLLLHPIPLSYFSVGQEVPDDLLLASKEYLLQRFIGDLDG